jgi:hypothetical protein
MSDDFHESHKREFRWLMFFYAIGFGSGVGLTFALIAVLETPRL